MSNYFVQKLLGSSRSHPFGVHSLPDDHRFLFLSRISDLFDVFSSDLKIDNENKQVSTNPNAIKINLKLNNESLSSMFGLEEGFTNVQEGFEDAPKNTKVKAK